MKERMVHVDDIGIFTREAGDGTPILLLHGFPQTGHCWHAVADNLARDHHVIVPDVPGFGRSGRAPDAEAGTVATILDRYLDQLGHERAVVVGHDWGGAFAFRMALDHPQRVEKLVITNSPFREMSLWRAWYVLYFNIPVIPELSFRVAGDRIIAGALKRASSNKAVFDEATVRIYQDAYSTKERVQSALAYYRTTTRRSLQKQVRGRLKGRGSLRPTGLEGSKARRITAPTLLVWGMKDPVLTPALIPGIKRDIPQAEVVELAGSGHFVPEESPEALAGAIRAFV
jgi:pimeloyl-ACP methyl ester carboxylesterase